MNAIKRIRQISGTITKESIRYGEAFKNVNNSLLQKTSELQKRFKDTFQGPSALEISEGIDLTGKTCLITGGNCGIGYEIVRALITRNCDVIMACRNPYTALNIAQNITNSNKHMLIYEANLAALSSVRSLCNKLIEDQKKLDIVILNAAVFGLPWSLTMDGIETTFQVNYLSQYYILMLLDNILADDARVVWLSSDTHRHVKWSAINMVAPTPEILSLPKEKYTAIKAYNVSKLCGLFSMHFLSYKWGKSSRSIFCATPGSYVKTNLSRNWQAYGFFKNCLHPFPKPVSHAAATPLFCAVSPTLNKHTAIYFKDCFPHDEGNLAKDFHLSVRINDITRSMIYDRVVGPESTISALQTGSEVSDTKPEKPATPAVPAASAVQIAPAEQAVPVVPAVKERVEGTILS